MTRPATPLALALALVLVLAVAPTADSRVTRCGHAAAKGVHRRGAKTCVRLGRRRFVVVTRSGSAFTRVVFLVRHGRRFSRAGFDRLRAAAAPGARVRVTAARWALVVSVPLRAAAGCRTGATLQARYQLRAGRWRHVRETTDPAACDKPASTTLVNRPQDRCVTDPAACDRPASTTLGKRTQDRCLPFLVNNQNVPVYPDGHVDGTWEASDPFKEFRDTLSVPCDLTGFGHGIQIITAPRRGGSYAGRFPVSYGDKIGALHGDRAQVQISKFQQYGASVLPQPQQMQGLERWYGFSVMFPSTFEVDTSSYKGGVLFAEFHNGGEIPAGACRVPETFQVNTNTGTPRLKLAVLGGDNTGTECQMTTTYTNDYSPVIYNQWLDYVIHAKWCYDQDCATNGLFEVWFNGVKIAEVHGPNMYSDAAVAWQLGNYRATPWTKPSDLYLDSIRIGNSYAEVDPAQ